MMRAKDEQEVANANPVSHFAQKDRRYVLIPLEQSMAVFGGCYPARIAAQAVRVRLCSFGHGPQTTLRRWTGSAPATMIVHIQTAQTRNRLPQAGALPPGGGRSAVLFRMPRASPDRASLA
jgi:hypothetical protein